MNISSAHIFAKQIKAGIVPVTPDYWINDYHVDHFHDLKTPTSYNSRPCGTYQAGNAFKITTLIEDAPSNTDCGVLGAKEIPIFHSDTSLDIPLYVNGVKINDKVVFTYRDLNAGGWTPNVRLAIYHDGVEYDYLSESTTITESNVQKVYLYAGVDTVSFWQNGAMSSINEYLFAGLAIFFPDDIWGTLSVKHLCGCFKLSYIKSATQGGELSQDWYTRP